ncbi:MAG: hypothetical protein GXP34_03105 [Actinobacteria bacterium]|nr:hypothetical protein [Actinomycetota bacterium]
MTDDAKSLDELLAELAEVQQRLLELSSDAFGERFELQKRQDVLREQTARFARDWDLDRSGEDLLTELASLRERLGQLDRQKIDVVTQGGAGTAAPAGDGWGAVQLNQAMGAAQGAGELHARIGRIKAILTDRGIDPDGE